MLVVGPKLCVSTESRFRSLLSQPAFSKRILALVIDEAHCISQWGSGFRPEYAELESVRAFIELRVAVHLASATMPPIVLAQARRTMHIHAENSFHLNLGNDRPNITWEVHRMSGGKSNIDALELIIPPDAAICRTLPRMVIFFDDIMESMRARRWFLEHLPARLHERVKTYNARKSQFSRDLTWERFRNREVDVLFASESAGMVSARWYNDLSHTKDKQGCDISDIELVVQFMAPESLSVLIQRSGRAGRQPGLQARAILLIEASAFHEKGKSVRQPGQPAEYVKQLEPGLRLYVEVPPDQCRRDVVDEYFDNPPRQTGQCEMSRGIQCLT